MGTVYILGAGATKAVAQYAPLNDDLLRKALDLSEPDIARRMHEVREFIFEFYPSAARNIPALEDLLSQLDLALNEGRPLSSTYTVDRIRDLRDGLVYGIAEVLRTSLARDHPSDHKVLPLLNKLLSRLKPEDTVVSLNYDIVFDNRLLNLRGPVNYGVPIRNGMESPQAGKWRREPYKVLGDSSPLYKPHGSLNWLFCRACQKLDVTAGLKSTHYIFNDPTLSCPDCDSRYEALIVAPTMFKSYSNLILAEIWRAVEDRLAKTGEVVFVGYSLPDADVHLRCILMRALFRNRNRASSPSVPVVRVVGYDERPPEEYYGGAPNPTHMRYQRLFGEVDFDPAGFVSYLQRDCKTTCQYMEGGVE